ncbi:MAG: UPF0755 protein [Alphaproteobacteria bacterium]|jgi:UPF0755 protein
MTIALRWLALVAGGLAAIAVLVLGLLFHAFDKPGALAGPAIVVVPKGAGVSTIARLLARNGIIRDALVFEAGVLITGNTAAMRAGEYEFPGHASAREVMDILRSGKTLLRRLTVPEGMTTAQVMGLVMAAYGLGGDPGSIPDEGTLLPDTYHYSYGDQRRDMIGRMTRAMSEMVKLLWRARAPKLPLTSPHEALVLASIVEKETGKPDERALIAGVFHNRLKRNMILQSDPTVAYGVAMAEGISDRVLGRALTRADLDRPGPYNTYRNRGLPLGAIANPGRAALEAVLHPASTDALYFVADGSGGHVFAKALDAHNRNVRRWRRLRDGAQRDPPRNVAPTSAP